MHQIHTTPGFIIAARPYGEAGKMLSIFTRNFGLVTAVAPGIRLEKSKLRYHTQEYSLGMFSLVRGREFWRLTSAQEEGARSKDDQKVVPAEAQEVKSEKRETKNSELTARLALLLKRLLQGEEARPEVFDTIQSAVEFMSRHSGITIDQRATLESLTVVRILYWLGYIGDDKELNGHMKSCEVSVDLLELLKDKRKIFNTHINKALKESQL